MIKHSTDIETGNNLVVTVRLFSCSHFSVLTTATSLFCRACAGEYEGNFTNLAGWMTSKPVAVTEYVLQESGEIQTRSLL